jgi:hypothetical protein
MALYQITDVELDSTGEVARVRWLSADHPKNRHTSVFDIVDVAEVVAAIDRGDIVELRFDGPHGPATGGHLSKKLLPNGTTTIAEAKVIPGRTLHDLPRI